MPEIERKFIVRELPTMSRAGPETLVRQGYLSVEPAEVRVRSHGDRKYELTVKSRGGLTRAEVNVPLTREQFEELWPLAERSIEKRRSLYAVDGWTAEVDVYDGRLAGLVVAEVEFPSEAEAGSFTPPPWFGKEVTDDARYRNAALAVAEGPPG